MKAYKITVEIKADTQQEADEAKKLFQEMLDTAPNFNAAGMAELASAYKNSPVAKISVNAILKNGQKKKTNA